MGKIEDVLFRYLPILPRFGGCHLFCLLKMRWRRMQHFLYFFPDPQGQGQFSSDAAFHSAFYFLDRLTQVFLTKHRHQRGSLYMIENRTFRLAISLPASVLHRFQDGAITIHMPNGPIPF